MKDLAEFRKIMKNQWQQERANRTLTLSGRSLEEILAQAAIELSLPLHKLDYEVQITGRKGFIFGTFGQRNWRVMVYPARQHINTVVGASMAGNIEEDVTSEEVNKDGVFGIRLSKDGKVMLKVVAASGNGVDVTSSAVLARASQMRTVPELKEKQINRIVQEKNGVWVEIAEYPYNPTADSALTITIAEDEMKATATLGTPGLGGSTVSYDEIKQALQRAGVYFGIKEDVLIEMEMNPTYRTAVVVAQGEMAIDGEDSRIKPLFETEVSEKSIQVDAKGSIDFKRMTMIQSVLQGDVIAKVLQPSDGTPGTTVRGSMIAAKNGERKQIALGENVRLSDDATEIIAVSSGQVLFKNDVISVENIYTVEGDLKSHIDFLGTVVINGNVEDGYEVKAKGDITVTGSVGRSQLTAGGNIMVGNGINGNKYGDGASGDVQSFVRAGKSLWASFIQNSYIEAHEMVVVSDGILNSNITSLGKVLCKGKRAAIVGGTIRAVDEINAVVFGSNSGTNTRLEVGSNPKIKDFLQETERDGEELQKQLVDLQRIIDNWSEAMRAKSLPPDKKKKYEEMTEQSIRLQDKIRQNRSKISELKAQLLSGHSDVKIAASMRIHSGVEIVIGEHEYPVSSDFNTGQTFYLSDDQIKIKGYEEITDDISVQGEVKHKKKYTKNSVKLA